MGSSRGFASALRAALITDTFLGQWAQNIPAFQRSRLARPSSHLGYLDSGRRNGNGSRRMFQRRQPTPSGLPQSPSTSRHQHHVIKSFSCSKKWAQHICCNNANPVAPPVSARLSHLVNMIPLEPSSPAFPCYSPARTAVPSRRTEYQVKR
ncbi:hypothetical protein CMEL01_16108 [Colletotrichum melonis]|uniref:Uncharacterized protein n=1 Tax=Colletotrichum melonis TaxID=1209925 RepID=A0AAI9UEU6_9PEZI|nr:hypothetical protein CMEL01_16108 [Colletotrichum melonis]